MTQDHYPLPIPEPMRRPLIDLRNNIIIHEGRKARVVMRKGVISVNCTDITIEAARNLVAEYSQLFPEQDRQIVVQEAEYSK